MSKGYTMLSNELMDSEDYFSERFTRMQAYMDLCLLASYKDRKFIKRGQIVELKAGQLAISEEELAERWKWSRNTVRKYLNEQQSIGNIEQQKNRLITITTVNFGLLSAQQIEQQALSISAQQIEQQNEQQQEDNIKIGNKELIDITPYNPPTGDDSEVLAKLSEMEKAFAELSEENKRLSEENAKLKKRKSKKEEQEKFDVRADLSYVTDYSEIWAEWLDYKDKIDKQYKTQSGASKEYKGFVKTANGSKAKAQAIIDQSVKNSWQGLFDVKDWVEPVEEKDPWIPNLEKYEPADLEFSERFNAYRIPNKFPICNHDWPYTPENRPDGARVCNGSDVWVWNAELKIWREDR